MPTPKSKRTIVLQSSNHDSEFDSLRDAVADSQNESTESDGADTLLAGYYADNGSSDGKKLKQLRPLGQQLFSSQEENSETIPVASDITLTNEPPVLKRTITVTNTNDRGPGSLRNAVAPSPDESTEYFNGSNGVLTVAASTFSGADEGQDTLTEYFNGSNGVLTVAGEGQDTLTGEGYSEARHNFTISTGNGNDLFRSTSISTIDTGDGNDSIIGGYSELRPISEILPLPPIPSFQFNGFPGLSLTISGNNSSRVFSS